MKNGVIASIVLSVVLTLTLAISTIATAFGGAAIATPDVYLAYRTNDICEELKGYKKVDLGFDTASASATIVYNSETGEYIAKKATTEEIKGSAVDNAGRTYNLHIEIFEQCTCANNETNEDHPWVIANAGHVLELSTLINDDDATNDPAYVAVKANVDMAKKSANFRPIGTVNHKYAGTIEGNNKTISNLTIHVTEANKDSYCAEIASNVCLDLGLFGVTDGATIKNVCLENETIIVDTNVDTSDLYRVNAGGLVGSANKTTIESTNNNSTISNKINAASSTSGLENGTHGVGGVVGCAYKLNSDADNETTQTKITGYIVNTKIIANRAITLDETNSEERIDGEDHHYRALMSASAPVYGGVVGYAHHTVVSNAVVTATVNATYNNGSRIGGVVGYLTKSAINNVTVAGVGVSGNETFKQISNSYAEMAKQELITTVGGVAQFVTSDSSITGVSVNNAAIDVKAKVAGVVFGNKGTITDAKVSGNIIGFQVGGIANVNEGTINYTSEFSGKTVSGNLKGVYVGGLAMSNKGTINGHISGEGEAEVKAEVDVYVKSVSGVVEDDALLQAIKTAYVAGLATYNANSISNFSVTATVADGLNMAGLVNVMGKDASGNAHSATLSGITANVNIISNNTTDDSTTYSIGGAVNNVYANSTISGNTLVVNVNKDRVSTHKYGAAFVGGLVARIYENNATITNNTVSGSIYTNFSKYSQEVKNGGEVVATCAQMNIGGLVGTIAGETNADSITAIGIGSITISGNTLENLDVRCEALLENIPDNNTTINGTFRKARNIATFIGLVYANGGTTSFATNKLDNVHAYAYQNTFTTVEVAGESDSRYGNSTYNGTINVLGSGYTITKITENAEHLNNYGFVEL